MSVIVCPIELGVVLRAINVFRNHLLAVSFSVIVSLEAVLNVADGGLAGAVSHIRQRRHVLDGRVLLTTISRVHWLRMVLSLREVTKQVSGGKQAHWRQDEIVFGSDSANRRLSSFTSQVPHSLYLLTIIYQGKDLIRDNRGLTYHVEEGNGMRKLSARGSRADTGAAKRQKIQAPNE